MEIEPRDVHLSPCVKNSSTSLSTTMATSVLQRPYRGSRVSSFYPVKSLPPISSLDSAFQLQEYISLLIRLDVHDVDAIVSLPGRLASKDQDETLDSPEPDPKKSEDGDRKSDISVDRACWIYEQLRSVRSTSYVYLPYSSFSYSRLAQDLSHPLITMLQQECTRSSCPQMKAGEWLYLCVAHGNDGAMEVRIQSIQQTPLHSDASDIKQCCAIDYILHTVDSATALLNSPRAFPSRYIFSRLLIHLFSALINYHIDFFHSSGSRFHRHHTGTSLRLPAVSAEFSRMPIFTIGKHLSKPKPNHRFMPASSNSLVNLSWCLQNSSSSLKVPSITTTRIITKK